MSANNDDLSHADISTGLDSLAAAEPVGSNCMFQLALMVARIALEPCAEDYKDESARALMEVIRAKPKGNVVRLFGGGPSRDPGETPRRAIA